MDKKFNTPTIFVIFGVTGDLSQKKLIPALFDLYIKKYLPTIFRIVGFSGQKFTNENFRKFVLDVLKKEKHKHKKEKIDNFLKYVFYKQGRFENIDTYRDLTECLAELDKKIGQCTNKLFYLSVPPVFYSDIFNNLAKSGLTKPCNDKIGWTRVLVEKPFGRDIDTARKLDKQLGGLFNEKQIFRIDHYLAKEAIQNILAFRFSNRLFEPVWNNKHIEKVEIKMFETIGIEKRGAFYSDVGALRDVGQNHMLQMLALIAMENPKEFKANKIRSERVKVLKNLKSINKNNVEKYVKRSQYKGFTEEKAVSKGSEIETFFKIENYIDNKRWKGVPFNIEFGKKMQEKKTEITVYFKKIEKCLCLPEKEVHHQNILKFRVQPNESIIVQFWAKRPGLKFNLEPKTLSFSYKDEFKEELLDAYQKVLFDAIIGDQILFNSTEEVEASWKFITPILNSWNKVKLEKY